MPGRKRLAADASRHQVPRFRGFLPLRSMGLGAIGGANGGSAGARTQDQYLKRVLLYQLSYRPVRWRGGRDNTLAPARCTHRLLGAVAPVAGARRCPGVAVSGGDAASSEGVGHRAALVRDCIRRSNITNT